MKNRREGGFNPGNGKSHHVIQRPKIQEGHRDRNGGKDHQRAKYRQIRPPKDERRVNRMCVFHLVTTNQIE